jgi:serine protease Do
MRKLPSSQIALVAVLILMIGGAANTVEAKDPRRTPIVEAVQKTRDSIVTVLVGKIGAGSSHDIVGTAVIVDERGYLVTNCHLLSSTDNLIVQFRDGNELAAQVVFQDDLRDLAVLRVFPKAKLQALVLGPGMDIMVGETVIAVGHPYGYTHTVSTGIVSAVGRQIKMPAGETLTNLIQTDASINPGNSGGPLLNINGELIGINVALREGAKGIAFAINSETIKDVLSRHLSGDNVAGVMHGMTCTDRVLPEGPARQRPIVSQVAERTPAAAAGMKQGDEIVRVADQPVCNRFDIERALWSHKAGDEVTVTLLRQGRELAIPLVLGAASKQSVAAKSPSPASGQPGAPVALRP